MKIRVLSGVVAAAVAIAALAIGMKIPIVYNVVMGLLGAIAVYEILETTSLCKNRFLQSTGYLLAILTPFISKELIPLDYSVVLVVFCVLQLLWSLKFHKYVPVSAATAAIAFPVILSYAFNTLCQILRSSDGKGLFYLIIILCFSAVADIGAYFVGVLFGKHKMSPIISPKKTVEGAVGGIVFSIIISLLACFCFSMFLDYKINSTIILLAAPFFVLLGMGGDLVASYIKRGCGIKDYGNIIPGHGGILDRFDSIIMIAPVFYQFLKLLPLVHSARG